MAEVILRHAEPSRQHSLTSLKVLLREFPVLFKRPCRFRHPMSTPCPWADRARVLRAECRRVLVRVGKGREQGLFFIHHYSYTQQETFYEAH